MLVFGRPEEDRKSFLRGRKKLPPLALVPRLCLGTHCPRGPRAQALPAEPGHEENFALPEACCRLSGCLPALSSACPGRICRPRWNSWIETLFRRRSNSWSRIRLAQFTPEGRLYYFPIPGSAAVRSLWARSIIRMEYIHQYIDIVHHLKEYLALGVDQLGPWLFVLLFVVIFCETGLVVTPFLPGDSLLFAVGAVAATTKLNLPLVLLLLACAAVLGDAVNYYIGYRAGPKVFASEKSRLFNKKHLLRARTVLREVWRQNDPAGPLHSHHPHFCSVRGRYRQDELPEVCSLQRDGRRGLGAALHALRLLHRHHPLGGGPLRERPGDYCPDFGDADGDRVLPGSATCSGRPARCCAADHFQRYLKKRMKVENELSFLFFLLPPFGVLHWST